MGHIFFFDSWDGRSYRIKAEDYNEFNQLMFDTDHKIDDEDVCEFVEGKDVEEITVDEFKALLNTRYPDEESEGTP